MRRIAAGAIACLLAAAPAVPGLAADNKYSYSADPSASTWVQVSDTEWTMDANNDGVTDIILDSSVNGDGQQVFTYTFNVEDNAPGYYVYEQMLKSGQFSSDTNLPSDTKTAGKNPLANGYTSSGSSTYTEQEADGSTVEKNHLAIGADPGYMAEGAENKTYTITNANSNAGTSTKFGSLQISKQVDTNNGANPMIDASQKFVFDITLEGSTSALRAAISGTKVFGPVAFQNGAGRVSLGNGETVTLTDIPEGITYSVKEEDADDYTEPDKTDTGTISHDTLSESSWTNVSTYTPPESRTPVTVTLVKKVAGAAAPSGASYTFQVHLENLDPLTEYTIATGTAGTDGTAAANSTDMKVKSGRDGIADAEISLKDEECAVLQQIPSGATYQFLEAAGDYIPSYTVTDSAGVGSIASTAATGKKAEELATAKETADSGEQVTVTYTNTYPAVQNLTVRKLVARNINGENITYGSGQYEALLKSYDESTSLTNAQKQQAKDDLEASYAQAFEMTVNFANLPADADITSDVGRITPDEYGEASKTFRIAGNGGSVTFSNLPAGATYQITEGGCDYSPAYLITTTDTAGNTISGTYTNGDSGSGWSDDKNDASGKSCSTNVETVEENESDTVTFTNTEIRLNQILPTTGGHGHAIWTIASAVLFAGFLVVLLAARKAEKAA